MKILAQGDGWIAFHKEAGCHVHPPEMNGYKVPRDKVCIFQARRQLGRRVWPVHRLDAGTTGVLLMALNQERASQLARQFQDRTVDKLYHAVVRGWTPETQVIDRPLEIELNRDPVECRTTYRRLATIELQEAVGKKFPTARYSYIEVEPLTGRFHQIRRHLNRIAHPIIGDSDHGDIYHNRFFRERLGIPGLCLRASKLGFDDPASGERVVVALEDDEQWKNLRELFKLVP